ncbi:MAG: hypothetical protein ACUZ8E_13085 [Candidatus Anammoxibacter sp.]
MQFIERLKNRVFGFIKKENGAVNLLDVAFAVGIGAALAAVVVPAATSALSTAKANALVDEIRNINGALGAMMADTGHLPDDPSNTGVIIDFNGGKNGVDGALNGTSLVGLRANGTDANTAIPNWKGPYISSDVVANPFGGQYKLRYDINLKDGATSIGVEGNTIIKARRDVIIQITALPANLQRLVDESMDDGVANTGWVQTGEANLTPQPSRRRSTY